MQNSKIKPVKSVARLERRLQIIDGLPRVEQYDAVVELGARLMVTLHDAAVESKARAMPDSISDAAEIAKVLTAEIERDPDLPATALRRMRALPCVARYILVKLDARKWMPSGKMRPQRRLGRDIAHFLELEAVPIAPKALMLPIAPGQGRQPAKARGGHRGHAAGGDHPAGNMFAPFDGTRHSGRHSGRRRRGR